MKNVLIIISEAVILFAACLLALKGLSGLVTFTCGHTFASGFFAEVFGCIATILSIISALSAVCYVHANID